MAEYSRESNDYPTINSSSTCPEEFSEYAEDFILRNMNDLLDLGDSETVTWIYEEICPEDDDDNNREINIHHLFVVSFDSTTSQYTYHMFYAEEWFEPEVSLGPYLTCDFFETHTENSDKFVPITKWAEFRSFLGVE